MHHYSHNIGDYRRRTGHLSLLEHGIYRQLMDTYYLDEEPIPNKTKEVFRRLQARTEEEQQAVRDVLTEFFVLRDGAWHHQHCDEVIAVYRTKAETARANGKLGGRPPKNQDGFKSEPKKKLTKNHKPRTNVDAPAAPARGTRFALETMPEDWRAFIVKERPDLSADATFSQFRDYWVAVPGAKGVKLDWLATWRNWVRNQTARPGLKAGEPVAEKAWHETREGVEQKAREIGHPPYDETMQFPAFKASVMRAAGELKAPALGLENLIDMAERRRHG